MKLDHIHLLNGTNRLFLQACVLLFSVFWLILPSSAAQLKIAAFGDSLFAGYQIAPEAAYPAQLETALHKSGYDVSIINAAVSGDTAEAGLKRLDWALADGVDAVLLELGANDMLRGIDPERAYQSLAQIIEKCQSQHIAIALFGMRADPALGPEYGRAFDDIYARLADRYHIPLYPFFLDGIVSEPNLKLHDGMHPNPSGVKILVKKTLPFVVTFLNNIKSH